MMKIYASLLSQLEGKTYKLFKPLKRKCKESKLFPMQDEKKTKIVLARINNRPVR